MLSRSFTKQFVTTKERNRIRKSANLVQFQPMNNLKVLLVLVTSYYLYALIYMENMLVSTFLVAGYLANTRVDTDSVKISENNSCDFLNSCLKKFVATLVITRVIIAKLNLQLTL